MRDTLARRVLLIVLEPANDRLPGEARVTLFRIRWFRSGSIGRPLAAVSTA